MSIQLKPGKWRTRDGRVAVVEFKTSRPSAEAPWIGYVDQANWFWSDNGKFWLNVEEADLDIIAPYTEPRLRPWKPEEVPVGALLRRGDDGPPMVILTRTRGGNGLWADVWDGSRYKSIPAELLLSDYTVSRDFGATWLPCGVMEDGE